MKYLDFPLSPYRVFRRRREAVLEAVEPDKRKRDLDNLPKALLDFILDKPIDIFEYTLNLAAGFQEAVVDSLVSRAWLALEQTMARLNDEKVFPDGHLAAGDFYFLRARDFGRAQEQYEAGARAFPKERATYQKRLVELLASPHSHS